MSRVTNGNKKRYKGELYIDQLEWAEHKRKLLGITDEEMVVVRKAAEAIREYAEEGKVEKTADTIVSEVVGSQKRVVELLNVAMPLARGGLSDE